VKRNEIDRILAEEDRITPSSRFVESVMRAVEREATALRPLEFPWLRILPAFVATIVALAVALWHGIAALDEPIAVAAFEGLGVQLTVVITSGGMRWLFLAAAITFVSVALPLSLMSFRRSAML
jgi:hypothetical protein